MNSFSNCYQTERHQIGLSIAPVLSTDTLKPCPVTQDIQTWFTLLCHNAARYPNQPIDSDNLSQGLYWNKTPSPNKLSNYPHLSFLNLELLPNRKLWPLNTLPVGENFLGHKTFKVTPPPSLLHTHTRDLQGTIHRVITETFFKTQKVIYTHLK